MTLCFTYFLQNLVCLPTVNIKDMSTGNQLYSSNKQIRPALTADGTREELSLSSKLRGRDVPFIDTLLASGSVDPRRDDLKR